MIKPRYIMLTKGEQDILAITAGISSATTAGYA
jgi:hypothetical protein